MNPGLFFFGVTVLLGYSALILVKSDDAASLHLGNPRLQPWASIDIPQHWALAPGACLLVSLHTLTDPAIRFVTLLRPRHLRAAAGKFFTKKPHAITN